MTLRKRRRFPWVVLTMLFGPAVPPVDIVVDEFGDMLWDESGNFITG